ncbi:MAG: hypothetical protein IJI61_09690 [Oscillospiraceae bacterium]|nr:hypothetical protein [Oscillospiraceae bacterium]
MIRKIFIQITVSVIMLTVMMNNIFALASYDDNWITPPEVEYETVCNSRQEFYFQVSIPDNEGIVYQVKVVKIENNNEQLVFYEYQGREADGFSQELWENCDFTVRDSDLVPNSCYEIIIEYWDRDDLDQMVYENRYRFLTAPENSILGNRVRLSAPASASRNACVEVTATLSGVVGEVQSVSLYNFEGTLIETLLGGAYTNYTFSTREDFVYCVVTTSQSTYVSQAVEIVRTTENGTIGPVVFTKTEETLVGTLGLPLSVSFEETPGAAWYNFEVYDGSDEFQFKTEEITGTTVILPTQDLEEGTYFLYAWAEGLGYASGSESVLEFKIDDIPVPEQMPPLTIEYFQIQNYYDGLSFSVSVSDELSILGVCRVTVLPAEEASEDPIYISEEEIESDSSEYAFHIDSSELVPGTVYRISVEHLKEGYLPWETENFVAVIDPKKTLTLPESLLEVQEEAFSGVDAHLLIIPDTVETIQSCAFTDSSIVAVICPEPFEIADEAFPNHDFVVLRQ